MTCDEAKRLIETGNRAAVFDWVRAHAVARPHRDERSDPEAGCRRDDEECAGGYLVENQNVSDCQT